MDVYHVAADETIRRLNGPADTYTAADGEIVILASVDDDRHAAHWAPALGLAAMRGVTVRRKA